MALKNKKKDMTPFDMLEKPAKQNPFLLPIVWGVSAFMTRRFGLKIEKQGMDRLRPPFLVLATHQGFSDYYIGPLALFPRRAMYVSDVEGFAAFGKGLYRSVGCIGKRRYTADIRVMKHISDAVRDGRIVVIYPESRHSNIGITSDIPRNMGRLVKLLKVPLVIISANGSYLANPFWNEEKTRKVPVRAKIECVLDACRIGEMEAEDIQALIEQKLQYDEYDYQHRNHIRISDPDRAEGLEYPLYQCIECGAKYRMHSEGAVLSCRSCGALWTLSEDGWLVSGQGKRIHPPDWYRKLRRDAETALADPSALNRSFAVRVEALPNEKGFVELGEGLLSLTGTAFTLACRGTDGEQQTLIFPHRTRESVQTEYNYKGKGKCIVLSTKDCCYYLYSEDAAFSPTELQFIGETLYRRLCINNAPPA